MSYLDFQTRLKMKQHKLVHGGKKSVYELADHLQKSYSYVCRICSMTEEVPFPSELEVPAMKFNRDFDVLQLKAWECGFALVNLPKVAMDKGDNNKMTAEYQRASSEAVSALIDVLENFTPETYQHFENAFKSIVEKSLSVKKSIDKKATKQMELF